MLLEPAAALIIGEHSCGEMARAHKLLGWIANYCHMKGCFSVEEHATTEAVQILTGEDYNPNQQEFGN